MQNSNILLNYKIILKKRHVGIIILYLLIGGKEYVNDR